MSGEAEIKKRMKHREDMFLRRLFGMLGKMAKADGRVDAWEAHAAEGAFAHWPRAAARRRFCVKAFNAGAHGRAALYALAWDFANNWATPEDCLAAYGLLWDIACSTGVLKGAHKAALKSVCRYLNLPERYFDIYLRQRLDTVRDNAEVEAAAARERMRQAEERRRREAEERRRAEEAAREAEEAAREAEDEREYQRCAWEWFHQQFRSEPPRRRKSSSPLAKEYALLGCASEASDEAVRRAYRAAAKACHPDLLRARGATAAQLQQATAKMAQLNAAWEKIRRARSM